MKIIVLEPGKQPEVKESSGSLKKLQLIVEGYIEVALSTHRYVVYCNEEGILRDLPFNCFRFTDRHPLLGTLVAVAIDSSGDSTEPGAIIFEQMMQIMNTLAASR